MLLPGPEKQNLKYEEARKRIDKVYRQHPRLGDLATQITTLLQSRDTIEKGLSKQKELLVQSLRQQYRGYMREHNISPRDLQPQFDCQRCEDSGWLEDVDDEASELYGYTVKKYVKCTCLINAEKQHRIDKLFARARMTEEQRRQRFTDFRLDVYSENKYNRDNFSYKDVMEENKRFAQDFVGSVKEAYIRQRNGLSVDCAIPSLFFWGPTGVGKTFLCSAIANALLELGVPVLYLPFIDLINAIRASFRDRSSNDAEQLLYEVRNVDVLIIDDLGAENSTPFVEETLFSILNYRMTSNLRPTVISSNLDPRTAGNTYNKRILSRIVQNSLILECMGGDLRKKFATNRRFKEFPTWK